MTDEQANGAQPVENRYQAAVAIARNSGYLLIVLAILYGIHEYLARDQQNTSTFITQLVRACGPVASQQ